MPPGPGRRTWTIQELETLRGMYTSDKFILEEIERKIPAHSRNAISCKASELGLYRPLLEVPEELQKPSPSLELDMSKGYFQVVDSNPLYSIVKEIQLVSLYRDTNSSHVKPDAEQLVSQTDINPQPLVISPQQWKEVGLILAEDNIRRVVFYLNLEGAATQRILSHVLNLKDLTAWRIIKHLETLKIAFPSMKISRSRGSKGGPLVTIYQTPDATPEQIQHAMTLHRKLESPQYLAAVSATQTILNDYLSDNKEISFKNLLQYTKNLGYRDPGIADLVTHLLQEQGIKVWR